VAGCGWKEGVVGYALAVADESSPQGRAFITGELQIRSNITETGTYRLLRFDSEHNILSTVDVLVATNDGLPFGVLEVDSQAGDAFNEDDITFLTAFANISRGRGQRSPSGGNAAEAPPDGGTCYRKRDSFSGAKAPGT
jgi:hypothetical protein